MKIGIGQPGTIPGVKAPLLLEWAKKADAGPFSSLGSIDRLVYSNYDTLTTFAAAAAVTQRIRLMTTVLLAPLYNTNILAKQAATIDAISGGRLTLGLGIGGREDDFLAASAAIHHRGKNFDKQLETMKRVWSGQPLSNSVGAIGPAPAQHGGPELLIGGYAPAAIQRVARWGDGFISGGAPPEAARQGYDLALKSWQEAGRPGKPRFVAGMYWGLGPNATERIGQYLSNYYAFLGPGVEQMIASFPSTPEALKAAIQAFEGVGLDELICWPCIPELDQVDRLADLVS